MRWNLFGKEGKVEQAIKTFTVDDKSINQAVKKLFEGGRFSSYYALTPGDYEAIKIEAKREDIKSMTRLSQIVEQYVRTRTENMTRNILSGQRPRSSESNTSEKRANEWIQQFRQDARDVGIRLSSPNDNVNTIASIVNKLNKNGNLTQDQVIIAVFGEDNFNRVIGAYNKKTNIIERAKQQRQVEQDKKRIREKFGRPNSQ